MDWEEAEYQYAYESHLAEIAEEEMIEDSIRKISHGAVQNYLGMYGDAISERVNHCIGEAEKLFERGFTSQALIISITAAEIIIRYFILEPLIQGVFLSDEWASILSKRVISSRSHEHRTLLPHVLESWDIDVEQIKLRNGAILWHILRDRLWHIRNKAVHMGYPVVADDAELGIECVKLLMSEIVNKIACKLGFRVIEGEVWHRRRIDDGTGLTQEYRYSSPFKD